MKTIKGVLIDVSNDNVEVIEIEKSLESYYRVLNCETIDIVSRKIGDKWFDIVCDDEGLFVANPKISAIDNMGKPQLVGNLFIVKFNGEDDITSLNEDDIRYVMKRVVVIGTNHYPNGYPMLTQLKYN